MEIKTGARHIVNLHVLCSCSCYCNAAILHVEVVHFALIIIIIVNSNRTLSSTTIEKVHFLHLKPTSFN